MARDYEKLAEQLKIEAPVLVRGTLMGDEDAAPKIAVKPGAAARRGAGKAAGWRAHPD
ncbi:MAG: hypothetical protein WDM87_13875 [Terracidiphilus sp.]